MPIRGNDVLICDQRVRCIQAQVCIGIRPVNADAGLVDGFDAVAPERVVEIGNEVGFTVPRIHHDDFTRVGEAALVVDRTWQRLAHVGNRVGGTILVELIGRIEAVRGQEVVGTCNSERLVFTGADRRTVREARMEVGKAAAACVRARHDVVVEDPAVRERGVCQVDVRQIDYRPGRVMDLDELASRRRYDDFGQEDCRLGLAWLAGAEACDRKRRCGRIVARLTVECVGSAEGPVRKHEVARVRARSGHAVGPAVRVLPGLAGSVRVDLAEDIGNVTREEQLDGIVAVDAQGRAARVVGREAKEAREACGLGSDIYISTGTDGDARERELLAVASTAIVGGADAVEAQVGDVVSCAKLDGLGHAAR